MPALFTSAALQAFDAGYDHSKRGSGFTWEKQCLMEVGCERLMMPSTIGRTALASAMTSCLTMQPGNNVS